MITFIMNLTIIIKSNMKIIYPVLFILLACISPVIVAQVPPVFSDESIAKMQKDELTQVYLSPERTVWKNDEVGKLVKNEKVLLKPGNGRTDLNKRKNCIMTTTEKPHLGDLKWAKGTYPTPY